VHLQLQRDTLQALQQQPSNLATSLAALATAQQQQQQQAPSKQQQFSNGSALEQQQQQGGYNSSMCAYCQGLTIDASSAGSFCSCTAGGPASLRTPSATAASTAHVALLLASWGYRVIVRKVLHSKAYWTKSMDNTFIVALDGSSGNHVEYIVDPHFQEAFNVGVMSDNYRCVGVCGELCRLLWGVGGGRSACAGGVGCCCCVAGPGVKAVDTHVWWCFSLVSEGWERCGGVLGGRVFGAPTLTWRLQQGPARRVSMGYIHASSISDTVRTWHTATSSCPRQGCST
jgi:hypothetical protein